MAVFSDYHTAGHGNALFPRDPVRNVLIHCNREPQAPEEIFSKRSRYG